MNASTAIIMRRKRNPMKNDKERTKVKTQESRENGQTGKIKPDYI